MILLKQSLIWKKKSRKQHQVNNLKLTDEKEENNEDVEAEPECKETIIWVAFFLGMVLCTVQVKFSAVSKQKHSYVQ